MAMLNGVRSSETTSNSIHQGINGSEGSEGSNGLERAMTFSLRESMHLVSDPGNLDASVDEVFRLMLGVNCTRQTKKPSLPVDPPGESVTAVVGFGGKLSGACVFRCSAQTAMSVAAHMTGMEFNEIDDTVQDGIGELCNMLAGAWKGKVPELAANCGLSVPAVITGRDYNLHVQSPQFQLHHYYSFDNACFEVTIVCDSLQ
jgi:chemotaxis protein CheX